MTQPSQGAFAAMLLALHMIYVCVGISKQIMQTSNLLTRAKQFHSSRWLIGRLLLFTRHDTLCLIDLRDHFFQRRIGDGDVHYTSRICEMR